MSKQTLSFQAEVAQLLHLVTHSLYSNQEIFLRELISNASDACDKLRFAGLNQPALFEDAPQLEVRVSFDQTARTLTITDNGIGMSQQEAIEHLGTIAKSGTKDFMGQLSGDQKQDAQLIGQFGVGFYSGFIVADKITVESRRAGLPASEGVRWASGGTGDFEVETIDRPARGTSVILHLRDSAEEYLNNWKLKSIISRYSDHISLPILMEKQEWKDGELINPGDEKGGRQPGAMVKTGDWETVNQASALWARPKKDVSDAQYAEFYKTISHDPLAPLTWAHNRVEGSTEYTQLLYIPAKAPFDLWNRDKKAGVKLYVKRVFIMDDAEALLPTYLRFVKGVIDSADLPLNVSRELLQESRDVRAIREGSTKRVLSMLEDLARHDRHDSPAPQPAEGADRVSDVVDADDKAKEGKYSQFYAEFGAVLKEGLGEDFANRERLARLLRFASTSSDQASVGLADYKARMKEGQEAIYYITADTLAAAKHSPQLEVFKKKGIEVLLMTDRVDEWALNYLHEFDGTPLQSVAKGAVDLGKLQDEAEKKAAEEAAEAFKPLLARLKETLKDKAEDVRVTTRLVDSPACLVVHGDGMSTQLARLLKQAGQQAPETKPVLEVNASHALVRKLDGSQHFDDLAHILFDQALLAEGGLPADPAAYVKRVNALLV
ncbi:molecular chaperone HtpG [Verminephrobacter eiseniae]|uniref:Chaperone protein HtpG n=1 Tax=Verminephrobacter eiseniae (strain EF01-2) TaxID=391735 RepID=HTPG_VEREI|nr:molecular chaperone HtpG [Verminephrobacter eiseniae]A1WF62.1 RecName: Full=Chaperone protein HtpG; AltName: Full=Heat shock protein HtpG; AltName: Full=High temperature protein G [Verminephrobacter eiseniae EF01-2]ABM56269.1 heat shock protein Hsp90 [Verminephrobacter eiseniae EF01-2]MCW5286634.1 molecular chaperone HtpG [Verminephrobacter eiseniae]MCW5304932.1 molecular chaperone HtpG [Verminephrobacter eiseniae]MCW8178672.1 molecular chaperone HtpG [Verminephrobacter eiseniae]MCW8190711